MSFRHESHQESNIELSDNSDPKQTEEYLELENKD